MSRASIVVLTLFTVAFLIAFMTATTNPRYIAQMELTIIWLRQVMGSFIAVAAALAILVRCLNGKQLDELLSLVIALFAGLAIITSEWTLTIPLGLMVIVYLVKEILTLLIAKAYGDRES